LGRAMRPSRLPFSAWGGLSPLLCSGPPPGFGCSPWLFRPAAVYSPGHGRSIFGAVLSWGSEWGDWGLSRWIPAAFCTYKSRLWFRSLLRQCDQGQTTCPASWFGPWKQFIVATFFLFSESQFLVCPVVFSPFRLWSGLCCHVGEVVFLVKGYS